MKTHTIEWTPLHTRDSRIVLVSPRPLGAVLGLATRLSLALLAAAALVVSVAWWVAQPELVVYLQALTWAGGFVFLALAVEAESLQSSLLNLATGLVLPVLAFASSRIAPEIAVVAAVLVAAWVAAAILRR